MSETHHLPAVLLEALGQGTVINSKGERDALHSNISLPEAITLYNAVCKVKPTNSAEVGFAQGVSAMAILKGLADNLQGVHHVMDPFQATFDDAGLAMVARAGLDSRLQFHRKFAEEVIPSLPPLQFGFIDSSHLFDLTICEFVLMDKKLEVGGLLAFHDMWMPSLQALTRYVLANRAYEVTREFSPPSETNRYSVPQRLKQGVRFMLHRLPGSSRLFRQEVLSPWSEMAISNLMILRKTGEDSRDWRYHARF